MARGPGYGFLCKTRDLIGYLLDIVVALFLGGGALVALARRGAARPAGGRVWPRLVRRRDGSGLLVQIQTRLRESAGGEYTHRTVNSALHFSNMTQYNWPDWELLHSNINPCDQKPSHKSRSPTHVKQTHLVLNELIHLTRWFTWCELVESNQCYFNSAALFKPNKLIWINWAGLTCMCEWGSRHCHS